MNITFGRAAMLIFSFACPCLTWAQLGTVSHDAALHRDPSTRSKTLEHLVAGTRVTLVDAIPDSGFYHVKTEDDQVGWIVSKYITVTEPSTPTTPVTPDTPQPPDTQCDAGLWNHVYHSQRLIVKQQCMAVTGTFVDATNGKQPDGVRHEADGDTHGWLRVDAEFQNLLNAGNMTAEGGNLVFEIVCRFPVTQPDAKSACQGFNDQVKLPAVSGAAGGQLKAALGIVTTTCCLPPAFLVGFDIHTMKHVGP